jgi:hypothetical protein
MNTSKKAASCEVCGAELKAGKKYCSRKCYWSISPRFEATCKQCGGAFMTYPSFVKDGQGFLCSTTCKHKWISENYRGEKSRAGYKNAQKEVACKHCGKAFTKYQSQIAAGRGTYCSKSCQVESFRDMMRDQTKTLRWVDGRSFLPYASTFNRKLKLQIKERDGFACQYCGRCDKLSIHHLDHDKQNNTPANLLTACMVCNIKRNTKKNMREDLERYNKELQNGYR